GPNPCRVTWRKVADGTLLTNFGAGEAVMENRSSSNCWSVRKPRTLGTMKFGISTFVTDEGINPLVLGPALEERGFDSVFLAEHSHIPVSRLSHLTSGGDLPRKYYRTLDPFVALTAMASVTSRLL